MKMWNKLKHLWHEFDFWFCKDLIEDELTQALHPDFGYVWMEGGDGDRFIKEARLQGFKAGQKDILGEFKDLEELENHFFLEGYDLAHNDWPLSYYNH